jgi:pimeloyl-ACP methyl ester carboxylesterase
MEETEGVEERLRLPMELAGERGGGDEELAVRIATPPARSEPRGAILYLHGFRSDQAGEKASYFRRRAVADGWLFASLDFRGHGVSGGRLEHLTLSRNLDDVARLHDLLIGRGFPRVTMVGSSMGGATALWHAARRPEGVERCLTLAPAVGMGEALESWAGVEGLATWERAGARRWADDKGTVELSWDLVLDLRTFPPEELARRLGDNGTPVLMLQGMRDDSVDYRGTVALAAAAGGAVEAHLFADGDHRLVDRLPRLWALMRERMRSRMTETAPGI